MYELLRWIQKAPRSSLNALESGRITGWAAHARCRLHWARSDRQALRLPLDEIRVLRSIPQTVEQRTDALVDS
ncbi:hypothetical protein NDU88_000287 [Pleurodeles waltl]|uniref:Uncharacterized protein n=1 Tax=Pleurodeles waltl TaxID=8319 RepID=A0AAV7KPK3_PLEWA|nr:hypothetical protein NDU88_000287 [Pleurodeles waltl]